MKNKKFIYSVIIPTVVFMFIFIVIPIGIGLAISFFNYNPLRDNNAFVGFENFVKLLKDKEFLVAMKNTFVFVFGTVFLNICLSLALAYFISRFKSNKVRSLFRMIFFLPCIAPVVATSVVFSRSIFPTDTGLLNMGLNALGLGSVNWLGDPNVLMISVIVYTLWVDVGYNIILFSAGMDGIPNHIYEASDLDNTSEFRKFFKITLPLLGRTFQFVLVQTLISHFQMFAQFSVLILKDGSKNSGLVLSRYIYKTAFEHKDMGYASAVSLVLFIIIMILSFIEQKKTQVDWEY
ncbi:carbohydrate ABC transporter permease [Bulleidia sp. zg-1006]|uniref:carbohydrate ABC transporter permease n=1 Tax=Bulleidia sp. zg-1006 TaxID=2806552 RepID=UPI00193A87E6|nr:sugar ABC transporter permease [Bulleidia sp. zg-1006]QRG86275.1 sugar ABC transporter permease [Bulleidia sp. zg-1006]